MFTGIIKNTGRVKSNFENKLEILTDINSTDKLSIGESISVNGICLTVIKINPDTFTVDYISETFKKTNIRSLKKDDLVNLELPATPTTFLSGHIVQGHIDTTGIIKSIDTNENSKIISISIPNPYPMYLVPKGSITLNGVSLTIIDTLEDSFTVGIIPHTWENTMLHTAKIGDKLNIEIDIMAKYLEKLFETK